MAYKRELDIEKLEKIVKTKGKKFVSLAEGAAVYSMGKNTFREMAKDARAIYRIKRRVLVNLEEMDKYLELFREES